MKPKGASRLVSQECPGPQGGRDMVPPVPPMSVLSSHLWVHRHSFRHYKVQPCSSANCSLPALPRMEVTQLGQGSPPDSSWLSRATNQSQREIPRLGNPPWFFTRPGLPLMPSPALNLKQIRPFPRSHRSAVSLIKRWDLEL